MLGHQNIVQIHQREWLWHNVIGESCQEIHCNKPTQQHSKCCPILCMNTLWYTYSNVTYYATHLFKQAYQSTVSRLITFDLRCWFRNVAFKHVVWTRSTAIPIRSTMSTYSPGNDANDFLHIRANFTFIFMSHLKHNHYISSLDKQYTHSMLLIVMYVVKSKNACMYSTAYWPYPDYIFVRKTSWLWLGKCICQEEEGGYTVAVLVKNVVGQRYASSTPPS